VPLPSGVAVGVRDERGHRPVTVGATSRFPSQDHRSPLLRFVRQSARNDGLPESRLDAEGVVQETFLLAYLNWATIQFPERWIYRVAARKVRGHSRQEWFQDRERCCCKLGTMMPGMAGSGVREHLLRTALPEGRDLVGGALVLGVLVRLVPGSTNDVRSRWSIGFGSW